MAEKESKAAASLAAPTANDILDYLADKGIIDLDGVEQELSKTRSKRILEKHPYAIYQGKDGRWRTHIRDYDKPENRRLLVKPTRESLEAAIVDAYQGLGQKGDKETIKTLYPRWIEHKRLYTNSEAYIFRIESEWTKHYKGSDIIDVPIVKLNKLELEEWAHRLIKTNCMTRKQYYNTTLIIRQLLEYAVDLGIISTNPYALVRVNAGRMFRQERKKSSETQVYTRSELAALYESATRDFERTEHKKHQLLPLLVMFQFQTGLRISEACALRYEDITSNSQLHIQRMYLSFDNSVVPYTKGTYGDRYVILTSKAKELIEMARQRQIEKGVSCSDYIFSMTDDPVPYGAVRKCYEKYCKEMGIKLKSSHKARKTFVSALIDGGVNINTVREIVGHTDEQTTLHNYCFDRSDMSERVALIEKALS